MREPCDLSRIYHAAAYNEITVVLLSHAENSMSPPAGRILALDLGKKRIGLALSDELGLTAQGLPTLMRINKRTDLAILRTLARERGVTQIVMGNPLHMSGDAGRQSNWAREFADSLHDSTGLPVRLWDERLTTVEASRVLRQSGIGIEKRAAAVDRLSAVILLQSYLDSLQYRREAGDQP